METSFLKRNSASSQIVMHLSVLKKFHENEVVKQGASNRLILFFSLNDLNSNLDILSDL